MPRLMRCKYCGSLQDEPQGAKICVQCGGALAFVTVGSEAESGSYVKAQLELDQIAAPAGQIVGRHLVITVETPDAVPQDERADAAAGREPLHFVAVLDTSGSMSGSKIASAKEAVRQAIHRLRDGDVFSLVAFATEARCLLGSRCVDDHLGRVIESALQKVRAGGQTALCAGLELGVEQALNAPQQTNLVLLLSDGQANVGETDVEAVGRPALKARAKGIVVSSLGVGYDYNEALMAEIAIDGGGRFYHIADVSRIAAYLTGELGEMASLTARNARVTLNLPEGTGVYPLSAAYPVQEHALALGDIPLATSLEIVVRVMLPPQPAGSWLPIDGTLHYESPAGTPLMTCLNRVTVRYEKGPLFAPAEGVVRPTVLRVLGHMQAAGVLATSKAATHGGSAARRQSEVELDTMREYAGLLGEDEEAVGTLSESEEILRMVAASEAAATSRAKTATQAAIRLHRGSKDFGKA